MGDEAKAETIPAPVETQATGSAALAQGPAAGAPGDYEALLPVDPAHYTVLREVARGGMGRILEARDRRLGRTVALKESVHGDVAARARFEREVRITARLQHPAIVAVHEAGTWPDGEPFFAMKRIHGRPLDVRIAEAGTFARRLELLPAVIAVVDALAFAHSERVIHRDLKPANVLVGAFGETVVIDWGIAKDLAAAEPDEVPAGPYRAAAGDQTIEGAVLGTPSYMPPEQASGERVDERADVYALGALLYQVLAGVPPYEGRTTADVLDRVLHEAPRPLDRLAPDAPADLVAIVEKAMARDPARRFRDAGEMAAELKRFQQGQLVASHHYTPLELALRWVRRHRAAVAVGAIALVVLGVLAAIGVARIVGAEERAELDAAAAQSRRDLALLDEAARVLDEDPTQALAILRELSPGSQEWRGARTVMADALARGVATVMAGDGAVESLAFSLDGRSLASAHASGAIHLWSVATGSGQLVGIVPGVRAVGLEPAGTLVALDESGRIVRLRPQPPTIATPELVLALDGEDFDGLGFNARGDALVVSRAGTEERRNRAVALVTLADRVLHPLPDVQLAVWEPSGDGLVLVSGFRTGGIERYDLATRMRSPILPERAVTRLATDGDRLWTVSWEGAATDLRTGRVYDVEAPVSKFAALPGGKLLVSPSTAPTFATLSETLQASDEGLTRRFHPRYLLRGRHTMVLYDRDVHWLHELRGHSDATLTQLEISSTGLIASGDERGGIRVWRLPPDRREHTSARAATQAHLARDGTTLVVARLGPSLEVRDLVTGAERRLELDRDPRGLAQPPSSLTMRIVPLGARRIIEKRDGHADQIVVLVASRDGRRLATLDDAGQIVAWDLDTGHGTLVAVRGLHVAISPDGERLALSRTEGSRSVLETWDVATGTFTAHGGVKSTAIAFASADRFAVATQDRTLYLFDRGKVTELASGGRIFRVLAFSPDGQRLVGGDDARALGAWDLAPARRWDHQLWHGHTGTLVALVFSPDGTRVASASADRTVRVWDVATGTATHVLREHTDLVTSLVWADADTVVTASDDRTARVWDLPSNRSRALRGFESPLVYAARTGNDIVAVDLAHQIARFPDGLPRDERLLRLALEVATNLAR